MANTGISQTKLLPDFDSLRFIMYCLPNLLAWVSVALPPPLYVTLCLAGREYRTEFVEFGIAHRAQL